MKFKKRSICWLALVGMTTVLPGRTQKSPHHANWMDYGGGVDAMQYSPLQQINKNECGPAYPSLVLFRARGERPIQLQPIDRGRQDVRSRQRQNDCLS